MTVGAVLAVCWPLVRRQKPARSGNDVAVYRDQLDEIDRDENASLIGKAEAEAARVEVSRRLISAAESAKAEGASACAPARLSRWATLAAAIVVLPLGAIAIYAALGSPNLAPVSMMSAEASSQAPALPEGIEQTVAQVEAYLEKNPDNGRGWELLAPVYIRLGRLDDAVKARRRALEIFGADAARLGDLGEAIVLASSGKVTPEAKGLFTRAEAVDPQDVMAQYYLGLAAKQEGRRDEAEKRWQALVSSAPEGAEYLPLIKRALARIDEPDPQPSSASADRNASSAPPDHDGNAIDGMVERLAERLKKDGSDVQGWIQLVRSYRVLRRADKATAAIADARAALAGDQNGLKQFENGLQEFNVDAAQADDSASPAASAPPAAGAPSPGPDSSAAGANTSHPDHSSASIDTMVERLAERLKKNGSDIAGWIQLVRSYRALGKADRAEAAIADAHAALASDPEALQQFDQSLQAQGGAVASAPASGAASPAPNAASMGQASIAPPGPTANQMAAAAQMAPAERNQMIEGMVARLAQQLSENGSDVNGWLRLIRAYSVLGERDKAQAAAANARSALTGNEDNLRRIGDLAKELGLEG